jgi:hypothetical protein
MGPGKALELLIKSVLLHIGFTEVRSDNRYIFDGTAGQMIQGLGDAHNADVLLEPPVQTPFYTPMRLLIECKDYCYPVSLNVLRSALGLREDINHFEIVDEEELRVRRQNRRAGIVHNHQRYLYQVAVASTSGFSGPAQNFALSHRIPLIEVNKMPFWEEFYAVARRTYKCTAEMEYHTMMADDRQLRDVIYEIASKSAVAITNTGQMLFLYRISGGKTDFDGQEGVFSVGDFHPSVKDSVHRYEARLISDEGEVFRVPVLPEKPSYFAFTAESERLFYRVEVHDLDRPYSLIGIGNPIWNARKLQQKGEEK